MNVFFSHSFCSLPNDRFNASPKACSPQSTIQCCPVNFQYPLVYVLSSSSCWRRPYCAPVTTKLSIIFPLITCFGKHCPRKKWPIKLQVSLLSFLPLLYVIPLLLDCMSYFISHTISPGDLLLPSPGHFKTSQIFLLYFPKCPISALYKAIFQMSVNKSIYVRFEV